MMGFDPAIAIAALLADSPAERPLDAPEDDPWDISYITDAMTDPLLQAASHHYLAHLRRVSSPVKKSTALASLVKINTTVYADQILGELKMAGKL